MKKLLIVSALLLALTVVGAQQTPEPLLTPDTVVTLDGRQMTGTEMKQAFDQYESEKRSTHDAYVEEVAPEKTNLVVPMAPEDRKSLELQKDGFARTAFDYMDANVVTEGRSGSQEFQTGYNQQWGKKETFAAYIDALLKIYGSTEYRALDAHCNAGGYVFNYQAKAVEFNMAMRNGSEPTGHTVLKIFGKTKFSYSGTTVYKKMFFQDEIGKSVTFFIGPVPVSVRGAIGGSAGFDAGVGVVGLGIQGTIKPGLTSYGKADAGVDLWFVKAGVEGSLDLLIDYLPAALTVQLLPQSVLEIALKVTNELKALSGKVVVFVKVKEFWKFWKDSWKQYSTTLFSWSGIQKSWVLFDKSLKVSLK